MSCSDRVDFHHYKTPEIFSSNIFDGFAIDIWAAASTLYLMLTGMPAYSKPWRADPYYRAFAVDGLLMATLQSWGRPISDEAGDLLQRMLREDPKDRLTLAQVMEHPWVTNSDVEAPVDMLL